MRRFVPLALSLLLFSAVSFAKSADQLAVEAVSSDSATASAAIRELREMGPAGLDALFAKYGTEIDAYGQTGDATDDWKRIARALDTAAMQYDSYAAHLYWYKDLDAAKHAAKAQHKPILSLRLLGNLNEEFSCANSRLFRAILYPNEQISKYLHDHYILHWKSVRPAPRITIDFGDGRKIERTITGNSIHYILSEDGDVIDALPGLYSPAEFIWYLAGADAMNTQLRTVPMAQRAGALMTFRKNSFDRIIAARDAAVEKSGVQLVEPKAGTIYDQIFQTPNYDKWLGLYSSDVYTALDGNGIIK